MGQAQGPCVRGLQKQMLTGRCKWIVLLLHVIDNKLRSKVLMQFGKHCPMISLSDYYFPPLSWFKLLSPCATPKPLYFLYNNCLHVCIPYKTELFEEKDLVWHSVSITSSKWVNVWAKEELVDKQTSQRDLCVERTCICYHLNFRATVQSRLKLTQRKFWPLSSAPVRWSLT